MLKDFNDGDCSGLGRIVPFSLEIAVLLFENFFSSCFDQFQSLFLGRFFMLVPNLASVFAQDIAFITK